MNIEFNRTAAIKKVFDDGKKPKEELVKLTLDYCLFGAITEEEKESLLAYIQTKSEEDKVVETEELQG